MNLANRLTAKKQRGRKRKLEATTAVAYIRVSTDEQANGPEAQREAIERYAQAHGMTLALVVEDIGTSGGAPLDERPELWRAIDSAVAERAAVLLVAKRDRLARDQFAAVVIERDLENKGVRIESADGAGNGSTPEAALLRSMLDAVAQYERAIIRARTTAALAAKARRGEGQPRLGTRRAADGIKLEVDPAERAIVDNMRTWRAAGMTLQAITDRLNAEVTPTRGKRWHLNSVARVLRRE